ncbi:alpha-hydroxy acid oxidase [Spirosoma linguale]|uniref:FMN-dependent alpha-hydroxy acid dehydrogenase n=1 Tax=Spirosoma linguale (strain ATCC 33905 / DSM 74 / LMG 10896 / Claus 1) TaxID=504472 RepID=D2QR10_SPILD|nr:FMN-dependent alpha-hydroxy acid dehydrogenase [Spirosoma linguale DSM 74]
MNVAERDLLDVNQLINLFDVEKLAAERMTPMAYEYVASGAADEFTLRWNRQALDSIKLNTRVLVDVSRIDTRVSLFGLDLAYPILVAPTAYHRTMHPEGELATARGAGAAEALYVVSSFTNTPLSEIASVATQPLWFQLYVSDDREQTKALVQEAEAQGCRALCVTVDTPVAGVRNRQQRVNFAMPEGIRTPHMADAFALTKSLTWKDVDWLQSFAKIPILLKGILNSDDAELAIQAGVSGIIVSNHGGRNLDTVPATIEALPRIAERVNKRVPVLMDGGIRRGTDVVKAIALGANAVLVGKPICFGLACGGADGVAKVLTILRTELELAMALTGKATLTDIDQSVIWR